MKIHCSFKGSSISKEDRSKAYKSIYASGYIKNNLMKYHSWTVEEHIDLCSNKKIISFSRPDHIKIYGIL